MIKYLSKSYQRGQVVVVVLLTMLVALSIGLVITQRTITDLSTSTESEQSSRALSAAEAGIEKAISEGLSVAGTTIPLGNDSVATQIVVKENLPTEVDEALEYPKIGKETIAHFWLANPDTLAPVYNGYTINLYFGNETIPAGSVEPAVEISILTYNATSSKYFLKKHFIDSDTTRSGASGNGFVNADISGSTVIAGQAKTFSPYKLAYGTSKFYARKLNLPISDASCGGSNFPANNLPGTPGCYAVLARVRILYTDDTQALALGPSSGPGITGLPGQASFYASTGRAGKTERKLVTFRQKNVIPNYFDFGLFSLGNITKNN